MSGPAAEAARLVSLRISTIHVPEDRARPVEEDRAQGMALEIAENGFVDPILVYPTPRKGEGAQYTLIDGAHRLRANVIAGQNEILALVIGTNKTKAELLEAGANLFRKMTVLDRAMSVKVWRKAWEKRNGKIARGGDQSATVAVWSDEALRLAAKAGVSRRTIDYAHNIGAGLTGVLAEAIREFSPGVADSQKTLLGLSERTPASQRLITNGLRSGMSLEEAISAIADPDSAERIPASEKRKKQAFNRVTNNWPQLTPSDKWAALERFDIIDLLTAEQKSILAERFGAEPGDRP